MAWLSGWAKRIKLTLDSDQIDAALSDFPVPVYLSSASGIGGVDVSCVFDELQSDANRKKIAVTTNDGTTQCYVEIERWDHASEKAWLHVRVGAIAADADTDIYLYYDSGNVDNTSYVGDTGEAAAASVWDSNFTGVWHMGQDPSTGSWAVKDSGLQNDVTPANMESGDLVDAQFGQGIGFDGSNERAEKDGIANGPSSAGTIEALAKPTSGFSGSSATQFLAQVTNSLTGPIRAILYLRAEDNSVRCLVENSGGSAAIITASLSEAFYHLAGSWDATSVKVYKNGVAGTNGAGKTITTAADDLDIAFNYYNATYGNYFNGVIDELRISKVKRSDAWLKATYYGLFDSLITFGAEEDQAVRLYPAVEFWSLLDVDPSLPTWAISGTVKEGGSPIARTVRAYKRSDGSLIDETTSDGGNGSFSFSDLPAEPLYVVTLDDENGEDYNALIFDRVLPKQVLN